MKADGREEDKEGGVVCLIKNIHVKLREVKGKHGTSYSKDSVGKDCAV